MNWLIFIALFLNIIYRVYNLKEIHKKKYENGYQNYTEELAEHIIKFQYSLIFFVMFVLFVSYLPIALMVNILLCIIIIATERNYLRSNGLRPISFNTLASLFFLIMSTFSLF